MTSIKSSLQYLLRGKDEIAGQKLRAYFNSIPDNPNILWYPSAGNDFRDITEFSLENATGHGIQVLPDIYLHNDCIDILKYRDIGKIYDDDGFAVSVNSSFELTLNPDANVAYYISSDCTWFYPDVPTDPRILLLEVTRCGKDGQSITANILFFIFENNNFLDEILLRFHIGISHFVKVREGLADGGSKISIAYALNLLTILGTKYLVFGDIGLCDAVMEIRTIEMERRLFEKHHLKPFGYKLTKISGIDNWSDFKTGIYSIEYSGTPVSEGYCISFLGLIGQ